MPELKPLPCPLCGNVEPKVNRGCGVVTCCEIAVDDVGAWNAIPRALRWTTEPPKVAGDCYIRTRPDESEQWNKPFVVFFSDGYIKDLKPTPLMQFAGPIAPPVEG